MSSAGYIKVMLLSAILMFGYMYMTTTRGGNEPTGTEPIGYTSSMVCTPDGTCTINAE